MSGISRRDFLRLGLIGVLGALGLASGGGIYSHQIEPHWLDLREVAIPLWNLPSALEGLTIAQLSDLHLGRHGGLDNLRHAVEEINARNPDLVVVTGDFILGGTRHGEVCGSALAGLKAPYGVYGVLGNHDVWEGSDQIAGGLAGHGIRLLRDERVSITYQGHRFWLLGLEDRGFTGMSSIVQFSAGVETSGLESVAESTITSSHQARFLYRWADAKEALQQLTIDLPDEEPRLLLVHNPDFAEMVDDVHLDLLLAGHTHGGQIRLPFLGAPLLPSCFGQKYAQGLVRTGDCWVYVNRGLGLITPAVRFNCRPEITILTLRQAT